MSGNGGNGGNGGGGGGDGGNAAAQPNVAAPNPARIILISPWQGEIDLDTKAGKVMWSEGITPLETKFSGYGKDLSRFLADVKNRVDKCHWTSIIMFGGKNLLTNYGEIDKADVIAAKDNRKATAPTTLAEARPIIDAKMMFFFLYDSLGSVPQKKLSTRLNDIDQDGPLLLKIVLDLTFVATQAATFTIKEKFYDLNLKKYKWNVQSLNQDVREKMADLEAAGHASDQTDVIISLFRAYATSTNDEFKSSITFWKNEWNTGSWTDVEDLMLKADSKYSELKELGSWGKRSAKDEQIIALTNKIANLEKGSKPTSGDKKNDKAASKWKYDRSQSSTTELKKNDKTYSWCDGPGHGGRGMWVLHKPGKCTPNSNQQGTNTNNPSTPQDKSSSSNSGAVDQQALTNLIRSTGATGDEVSSKMQAILAVMNS